MAVPILKMITVGILPSPLKVLWYKLHGAKIGKRVSIGLFSIITSKSIEIDDDSSIGPLTFISCDSFKLGKRVKVNMMVAIETGKVSVDNDSTIMEQVVIGGMLTSRSAITIGKRVKIFPFSFLNPTEPIILEDDVGIGGSNYIFTHGSWQSILDGFPVSFGPVTIKRGVWFPWRVFVMPNVTVGEYATIGAGSVITKDIPGRSLAAGMPAKVLRSGNEYIKEHSEDEKHRIIGEEILTEFADFLSYKFNGPFKYQKTDDGAIITLPDNKTGWVYKKEITTAMDSAILLSLRPMSTAISTALNQNNALWFDIEGKRTFYSNNGYWRETKDFFSRYGVRFEIES